MLATGQGRKAALAWAAGLRGDRTRIMKAFIADATALAAARQRGDLRSGHERARRRAAFCSPARPPRARRDVRTARAPEKTQRPVSAAMPA